MKDSLKTDYQVVNMPIVRVIPKPVKNNSMGIYAPTTNHIDKNKVQINKKGSGLSIT